MCVVEELLEFLLVFVVAESGCYGMRREVIFLCATCNMEMAPGVRVCCFSCAAQICVFMSV
jgi:hypothetical protein